MKALADDPTVPLFFGRLDYDDGATEDAATASGSTSAAGTSATRSASRWSSTGGRRSSLPFYRASRAEPMGVELRRRFGFQHGATDRLRGRGPRRPRRGGEEYSAILEAEIERPRVGPMRDIVATIQPEQDVIVRSDLSQSVCVQGAPGTGKTAVGLHRAAYLLYAHRDQLTRQGVLVVGPERAASCATSATCCRRSARSTRRSPRSRSSSARRCAAQPALGGARRGRRPRWPRSRATPGWPRCCARALWSHVQAPAEGLRRAARRAAVAGRDVRGRGGGRRRCARAGCGTARPARWCRRRWPTGSW